MNSAPAPADTDRRIHIALTFDDNFWAPSYATMRSICVTTARRADLVFHLVHVGLKPEHARRLDAISEEFGASLVHYDLDAMPDVAARIAAFPRIRYSNLNAIVYARLFLPDILPGEIDRLIFIDGDILVRIAIERFYDIDLEDNVVAAAICPHRVMFQSHRDLRRKDYFNTEDPYFNAGFLLIDMARYRAIDFAEVVETRIPEAQRADLYYDQDILNIALRNRVKLLDTSWNLQNPLPAHESFDPKIVHYTGRNKPWRLFATSAFKRLYRHTMTNEVYYDFLRERLMRKARRFFRIG